MAAPQSRLALLTLASVAALCATNPALAQGYNWTGFYFGANAGGTWSNGDTSSDTNGCRPAATGDVGYFCDPGFTSNGVAVAAAGSGSGSGNGFSGGVQAGYNLQSGGLVFGGELDFGTFGFSAKRTGSARYPANYFPVSTANTFTVTTKSDADWLFTARARLGFLASPNLLLYVTGGLAVADVSVANAFSDNVASGGFPGATGSSSNSTTKAGWVLGIGGEMALDRNWSLKAEYLHVDLGSISTTATITHRNWVGYSNTLNTKADITAEIARVGVNYKF